MSYIHVTIKTKSTDTWACVFKDLSEQDLKKKLLKPYNLGQPIYYDGKILSPNEITRIKINKTQRTHIEELKSVQEESFKSVQEFNNSNAGVIIVSAGHGYEDYEINECGTDVTDLYISAGPGSGTSFTKVNDFIKHPWVVRIIPGVIAVAIIAYLKFK